MQISDTKIEYISSFVRENRDKISPKLASAAAIWCACESRILMLVNCETIDDKICPDLEAKRQEIERGAQAASRALNEAVCHSVWDAALKLLIWRWVTAPNTDDYSQFTSSEQMALSACDALLAILGEAEENWDGGHRAYASR